MANTVSVTENGVVRRVAFGTPVADIHKALDNHKTLVKQTDNTRLIFAKYMLQVVQCVLALDTIHNAMHATDAVRDSIVDRLTNISTADLYGTTLADAVIRLKALLANALIPVGLVEWYRQLMIPRMMHPSKSKGMIIPLALQSLDYIDYLAEGLTSGTFRDGVLTASDTIWYDDVNSAALKLDKPDTNPQLFAPLRESGLVVEGMDYSPLPVVHDPQGCLEILQMPTPIPDPTGATADPWYIANDGSKISPGETYFGQAETDLVGKTIGKAIWNVETLDGSAPHRSILRDGIRIATIAPSFKFFNSPLLWRWYDVDTWSWNTTTPEASYGSGSPGFSYGGMLLSRIISSGGTYTIHSYGLEDEQKVIHRGEFAKIWADSPNGDYFLHSLPHIRPLSPNELFEPLRGNVNRLMGTVMKPIGGDTRSEEIEDRFP
jgi:hypothetical protein